MTVAAGVHDVPTTLRAVASFALLFTVSPGSRAGPAKVAAAAKAAGLAEFSAAELAAYQALRDETELHVLGSAFVKAGRLTQLPMGRIALAPSVSDPQAPQAADVRLFMHVSGAALWEVWLPGQPRNFDAQRWVSWLDDQAGDSLPCRV